MALLLHVESVKYYWVEKVADGPLATFTNSIFSVAAPPPLVLGIRSTGKLITLPFVSYNVLTIFAFSLKEFNLVPTIQSLSKAYSDKLGRLLLVACLLERLCIKQYLSVLIDLGLVKTGLEQ